jgi:DNA-binding winged helix-turn-helix (wHTH) protein/tetratricopeptide (TPR) repeat protein
MRYGFGPFIADRTSYRVERDGKPIELTPKLLDLLFFLLDRPATLVTKEELLEGVWPGANVTDNALAQAMSELREALGDRASSPVFIRTVARRGYRFIAPVETVQLGSSPGGLTAGARREFANAGAAAATDTRAGAGMSTIGVADFQNVSGDADLAWLAAGIAETVTNDLRALGHFCVIERWRVVQAARQSDGAIDELGRTVGADFLVTGSYQCSGSRLRLTARLVDVSRGAALVTTKVDGEVTAVFDLQDAIVSNLARELGLPSAPAVKRLGVRETSSLDAYRAYTEGLLRLESLDTTLIGQAIADFRRAIAHDPEYAMAYAGLANAEFAAYERTRTTAAPDLRALESGIAHAHRAIQLDDQLAEAHATLSFLLASAMHIDEARAAAERAVSIEPDNWRHLYRLGHALWGGARLRALQRASAYYPLFAYASFESAMVYVARGDLEAAERIARPLVEAYTRRPATASRFPGVGFGWLLGAIDAAAGRVDAAIAQFDLEMAHTDARRLYGPEYAAAACVNRGHALLVLGRRHEALASFQEAHTHVHHDLRAAIGEALALERLGRAEEAKPLWRLLRELAAGADAGPRLANAVVTSACATLARGDAEGFVARMTDLLDRLPPCHVGWHLPIEPVVLAAGAHAGVAAVLRRIAERAT